MLKKISIILFSAIIMLSLLNFDKVYADPNSSKGFAEYDDATAEEEYQEQIKQQEQHLSETANKSTNNFLEDLQVEGYNITPQFDKQTLQYTIEEEVKTDSINIIAKPSDQKATISGAGTIKLIDGQNEYRVDVTAESGTVRTYIIKLKQDESNMQDEENELTEENATSVIEENDNTQNNNFLYIILAIIVIVAIVIAAFLIINKNKGKHEK